MRTLAVLVVGGVAGGIVAIVFFAALFVVAKWLGS